MNAHRLLLTGLLLPAFLLGGCTFTRDILKGDKLDYKSATTAKDAPTLEVPPDLTQPTINQRFTTPTSDAAKKPVLASEAQTARPAGLPVASGVLPVVKNARIERAGTQRWLVITGRPDQYWDAVKEFWQERGFVISAEKPEAGTMETDWAENRAKIGQDFIRNTLGRVLEGIYSTPERDKFRTRFEINANGETEIFISHRGMIEVYKNEAREQTIWQPREADPGLEAEFLSLLMVRLGTADEQRAKQIVASAPNAPEKAVLKNNAVELDETFDRAWRRVGLALDRVGFTVEDRDRSKGLFFVRYADPDAGMNKKPTGIFGKVGEWFKSDKVVAAEQYQIQVSDTAPATRVTVLSKSGAQESSQTSQRILSLLQAQLK